MAARTKWVEVRDDAYAVLFPGRANQVYNMPANAVTPYNSTHVIIVDDDPSVDGAGDAAKIEHASCCNDIRNMFSQLVDNCTIHSIRMNDGQRARHFMQDIEQLLAQFTENDIVFIYFHGGAGGVGDDYTWRLRGPGPSSINASELIALARRSEPDLCFLVDAFIPTEPQETWTREDRVTEFLATGAQKRDAHTARPVTGRENFTAVLCDSMRDMITRPRGRVRQTIGHIMGRSKVRVTDPVRIWVDKPVRRGKGSDKEVSRICVEKETVTTTRKFAFLKCRVTGRNEGELDPDGGDGNDGNDGDNGANGNNGGDRNGGGNDDNDSNDGDGHGGDGDLGVAHRRGAHFHRRGSSNHTSRNGNRDSLWDMLGLDPRLDQDQNVLNDPAVMRHVRRLKSAIRQIDAQPRDEAPEMSRSRPRTEFQRDIRTPTSPFSRYARVLLERKNRAKENSSNAYEHKGKGKMPAGACIDLTFEEELNGLTEGGRQQEFGQGIAGNDKVHDDPTADAKSWWSTGIWNPLKRSSSASPVDADRKPKRPFKKSSTPAFVQPAIENTLFQRAQSVSSDCEITEVRPRTSRRAEETVDLTREDNDESLFMPI